MSREEFVRMAQALEDISTRTRLFGLLRAVMQRPELAYEDAESLRSLGVREQAGDGIVFDHGASSDSPALRLAAALQWLLDMPLIRPSQEVIDQMAQLAGEVFDYPEVKNAAVKAGLAHARSEAASGKRGSRWPLLDAWLDEQLASGPMTAKELWEYLPRDTSLDLHRNGDAAVERRPLKHGTKRPGAAVNKPLRWLGFVDRVTAAKKRRGKKGPIRRLPES